MEETNHKNMIHAFTAGCLEKDELKQVKNEMESDETSAVEIGELQNVISLLPAILELEHPRPGLKDKIAKRLQKYSDEIKERKKQGEAAKQPFPEPTEVEEQEIENPSVDEEYPETASVQSEKTETAPPVSNYEKFLIDENQFSGFRDKIDEEYSESSPVVEPEIPVKEEKGISHLLDSESYKPKRESKSGLYILTTSLFIISLIIIAIVYFTTNSVIHNDKEQISILSEQANTLNNEIIRLKRIIYITGLRDIWIVNLEGTVYNPMGSGKLSLDYQSKDGLLQLYNMPALASNQFYHLWLIGEEQTYSLGSYKPGKNGEYLTINLLPDIPQNEINSFIVTVEENENPPLPSGLQYLSATLKNIIYRR